LRQEQTQEATSTSYTVVEWMTKLKNSISFSKQVSFLKVGFEASEMKSFHINVQRLIMKITLIENLKNHQIEYINAFDIHSNGIKEDIDTELKRLYTSKDNLVILWYACDRLKREQINKWEEIHQQLILERQQTIKPIKIVYVDFSQCERPLAGFTIVRLSLLETSQVQQDPIKGRREIFYYYKK